MIGISYDDRSLCGSQNRAGRSLCPAEARNSFDTRLRSPQAAARERL